MAVGLTYIFAILGFKTMAVQGSHPVHDEDDDEDDDMDEEEEEVAYQDDEELDAEDDIGVGSMEVHDMHLGGDGAGNLPAAPVAPAEPEPSIARCSSLCLTCQRAVVVHPLLIKEAVCAPEILWQRSMPASYVLISF